MSFEYVKAWERDGAVFRRMLDAAEAVLRRAVESRLASAGERRPMLDPVISREHGEAPQVSVRWRSADGLDRAVHVDVVCDDRASTGERCSYDVAIAASRDDFEGRERRWLYERETTRARLEELYEAVHAALETAQALRLDDLKDSSELPSLPPGLSTERRAQILY
jgi:hypothetical protein